MDGGYADFTVAAAGCATNERAQRGNAVSERASESMSQRLREGLTERSEGMR